MGQRDTANRRVCLVAYNRTNKRQANETEKSAAREEAALSEELWSRLKEIGERAEGELEEGESGEGELEEGELEEGESEVFFPGGGGTGARVGAGVAAGGPAGAPCRAGHVPHRRRHAGGHAAVARACCQGLNLARQAPARVLPTPRAGAGQPGPLVHCANSLCSICV